MIPGLPRSIMCGKRPVVPSGNGTSDTGHQATLAVPSATGDGARLGGSAGGIVDDTLAAAGVSKDSAISMRAAFVTANRRLDPTPNQGLPLPVRLWSSG